MLKERVPDARLTRLIWRELLKRSIDASKMQVTVIQGIVYLAGRLGCQRSLQINLKNELEIIILVIRQIKGVRDVDTHFLRLEDFF